MFALGSWFGFDDQCARLSVARFSERVVGKALVPNYYFRAKSTGPPLFLREGSLQLAIGAKEANSELRYNALRGQRGKPLQRMRSKSSTTRSLAGATQ